jgi:nanoRNase/pAp phosphatase (c-di-AMP/oligoRNAs hydrolase)
VKVSVILTEAFRAEGETGHITKASFRAKSGPGGVDVGSVAARLGGGGHIPAAGAKLALPMAEAKKKVIEALK